VIASRRSGSAAPRSGAARPAPSTGAREATGPAPVHVVAGVLERAGSVLLSRRHGDRHQGGLWEFPGGKLHPGETPRRALGRELGEELGVRVRAARPLIRVPHAYPDRRVLLDVWRVLRWQGEPAGRERQPLRWVPVETLDRRQLPAADEPVVAAVRLPSVYLITPEPGPDRSRFLDRLERSLERGARLVQLRAKLLSRDALVPFAAECVRRCHAAGAKLLINADPGLVGAVGADGVHLDARRLAGCEHRPLGRDAWVGASCHDAGGLARAVRIGADFAVLSPVARTPTHPGAETLGWDRFRALVEPAAVPVYALGGMGCGNRARAWRHGGQGIAGIRALWCGRGRLDASE